MAHRSWLLVPGDSEKKLAMAVSTGADVVVVDLEAMVSPDAKSTARLRAAEWLAAHRQQVTQRPVARWVRINSLESRQWQPDLKAVMPGVPDGVILPRAANPDSVRQVAAELYELEQDFHITPGSTRIMAMVGDTPLTALTISAFAVDAHQPRMGAIGWGAECLARTINAARIRDAKGTLTDTFGTIRTQALLAAHSCGVMAIEAMQPDLIDPKKLKARARESRLDGFSGMLVFHPAQVAEVNSAFLPSESELAHAHQIVSAFAGDTAPEDSVIDRRRVEPGQLRLAQQMLAIEEAQAKAKKAGKNAGKAILRPA